jgi:hypothetical protein
MQSLCRLALLVLPCSPAAPAVARTSAMLLVFARAACPRHASDLSGCRGRRRPSELPSLTAPSQSSNPVPGATSEVAPTRSAAPLSSSYIRLPNLWIVNLAAASSTRHKHVASSLSWFQRPWPSG